MQDNKTGIFIFIFLFIVGCRSLDDQTSDIVVVPLQYQDTDTLIEGGVFKFFRNRKIDTIIEYPGEKIKGTIGLLHIQDIIEEVKRPNPGILAFKALHKGKYIMIFDTNGNNSLSDEKPYECDKNKKVKIDRIKLLDGNNIIITSLYFNPSKSSLIFKTNSEDKLSDYGVSIVNKYKYGYLTDQAKKYPIIVGNYFNNIYRKDNTNIYVLKSLIMKKGFRIWELPQYHVGDTIYTSNSVFKFVSLDSMGNSISFRKIHLSKEGNGIEAGFKAIRVNMISITDKTTVNFSKTGYTLLDFWGTWCTPCRELEPELMALYKKYKPDNLKIIGIANDDYKSVSEYIKGQNIPWINVLDPFETAPICRTYKISSFPTYILINAEGEIVYRGSGRSALDKIKLILQ
ncbi:MAG: TlpA family protein disulfide reductase [Sphingobacteriia bacterium]|nr:TlpA family protein disulfide reductase [Sphingobacteriia bacterium]